jgi:hypothetical protein
MFGQDLGEAARARQGGIPGQILDFLCLIGLKGALLLKN